MQVGRVGGLLVAGEIQVQRVRSGRDGLRNGAGRIAAEFQVAGVDGKRAGRHTQQAGRALGIKSVGDRPVGSLEDCERQRAIREIDAGSSRARPCAKERLHPGDSDEHFRRSVALGSVADVRRAGSEGGESSQCKAKAVERRRKPASAEVVGRGQIAGRAVQRCSQRQRRSAARDSDRSGRQPAAEDIVDVGQRDSRILDCQDRTDSNTRGESGGRGIDVNAGRLHHQSVHRYRKAVERRKGEARVVDGRNGGRPRRQRHVARSHRKLIADGETCAAGQEGELARRGRVREIIASRELRERGGEESRAREQTERPQGRGDAPAYRLGLADIDGEVAYINRKAREREKGSDRHRTRARDAEGAEREPGRGQIEAAQIVAAQTRKQICADRGIRHLHDVRKPGVQIHGTEMNRERVTKRYVEIGDLQSKVGRRVDRIGQIVGTRKVAKLQAEKRHRRKEHNPRRRHRDPAGHHRRCSVLETQIGERERDAVGLDEAADAHRTAARPGGIADREPILAEDQVVDLDGAEPGELRGSYGCGGNCSHDRLARRQNHVRAARRHLKRVADPEREAIDVDGQLPCPCSARPVEAAEIIARCDAGGTELYEPAGRIELHTGKGEPDGAAQRGRIGAVPVRDIEARDRQRRRGGGDDPAQAGRGSGETEAVEAEAVGPEDEVGKRSV